VKHDIEVAGIRVMAKDMLKLADKPYDLEITIVIASDVQKRAQFVT
jgi:hypothetical protein